MVILYYSGTESLGVALDLAKREVKTQLVSYLYLAKKGANIKEHLEKRKQAGVIMFLDSGAHTLRQHSKDARGFHVRKKKMEVQPIAYYQQYVDDYIEFLKKYQHYFKTFVNVDIENVVGQAQVDKWNEQIINEVGREPLVVWHRQGGYQLIEKFCKRFKNVGIGRGNKSHVMSRLFLAARKNKTKVHGFALTDYKSIARWPFYSVDSTSWMTGSMYGLNVAFRGRKLRHIPKGTRRNYRSFCEKNNIDFDNLIKDKNKETDIFNACQWREFLSHVNSYKRKVGLEYWEDEDDTSKTN